MSTTRVVIFVLSAVVALGSAGCKGKKGKPGTDPAVTAGTADAPKPKQRQSIRKKLLSNVEYTKKAAFTDFSTKIPAVADACQKAKKYVSSLTWCDDWKKLKTDLDAVLKPMDPKEPKTIRKAMAVVTAAAKVLANESLFVRYTALEVLNWTIYEMAHKNVGDGTRKQVRRLLAWVYRHDKEADARSKAITILGSDGGTVAFRGDKRTAKVLFKAAGKDTDKGVRRQALSSLSGCVKAGPERCPLTPEQLRAWFAAEQDPSNKQSIGGLAGKLKMSKEVFDWCKSFLADGTLYWGCRDGFRAALSKDNFDAFLALANAFKDGDVSKKKHDFRMTFVAEILFAGLKRGTPRDKTVAYLEAVLAQAESKSERSPSSITYIVGRLAREAADKAEATMLTKALKKHQKAYKKAWGKDKSKKDYLKSFDDALKALEAKAKA